MIQVQNLIILFIIISPAHHLAASRNLWQWNSRLSQTMVMSVKSLLANASLMSHDSELPCNKEQTSKHIKTTLKTLVLSKVAHVGPRAQGGKYNALLFGSSFMKVQREMLIWSTTKSLLVCPRIRGWWSPGQPPGWKARSPPDVKERNFCKKFYFVPSNLDKDQLGNND